MMPNAEKRSSDSRGLRQAIGEESFPHAVVLPYGQHFRLTAYYPNEGQLCRETLASR